jgi:hypothetical protein
MLIVIGGASRTKEEVLLAQERGIDVIPWAQAAGQHLTFGFNTTVLVNIPTWHLSRS